MAVKIKIRIVLMWVLTVLIFLSPLLPIFAVPYALPGVDGEGNDIIIHYTDYYSVIMLLTEFSSGYPFVITTLPYIYILSTTTYGAFYAMCFFGEKYSIKALKFLLIFPLIVTFITFMNPTILGTLMAIAIIIALKFLMTNPEQNFQYKLKVKETLDKEE